MNASADVEGVRRNGRRAAVVVALLPMLTVGSVAGACGTDGPPKVAATVGRATVTSSEVERLTEQWLRSSARLETDGNAKAPIGRKEAARNTLIYLIRLAELDQLAAELGVNASAPPAAAELAAAEVPSSDLEDSGWSRPDFVKTFRASRVSRAMAEKIFPQVAVPDSKLRQDYDQHPDAFGSSWEARVGIAYFDIEAPARQLSEQMLAGEAFEAAARRLGAREATTVERVTPLTTLPPLALSAMATSPPGKISAPVPSGGGFLVFVVESRHDLPARSFEEVKDELRGRFEDHERQGRFMTWFVRRLGKERIRVSSYYGRWDAATGLIS